jgi:hypothetical protein
MGSYRFRITGEIYFSLEAKTEPEAFAQARDFIAANSDGVNLPLVIGPKDEDMEGRAYFDIDPESGEALNLECEGDDE